MKRKKMLALALAVFFVLAAVAVAGAFRLTTIDIEPRAASGPVETFVTEAFKVDLPAGFKPYLITYALYWPDGRIIFEEMAVRWPLKSATSHLRDLEARTSGAGGREAGASAESPAAAEPSWLEDLSAVMGRPAVLVLENSPGSGDREDAAVDSGRPLVMEVRAGDGWLRFFEALASDAPNWNPAVEGEPERYQFRREQFVSRVKEFLDHYVWIGTQDYSPGEGVYRTRYGVVSKGGDESFVFSVALARFIDDDRRMGLNIDARQGYYDWGGLQLCEADRLTRIVDQLNLTGTSLARTNCFQIPVGGRSGYERIVYEGLGSPGPGSAYTLDWQEDWTKTRIGNFLISFHLTSPSGGNVSDSPETVLGQWRAMLNSVSFEPLPWDSQTLAAAP